MSFNSELLDEIAGLIDDAHIDREVLWLRIADAMRGQTVRFPNCRSAWLRAAVRKMHATGKCSLRGIARALGVSPDRVWRIVSSKTNRKSRRL